MDKKTVFIKTTKGDSEGANLSSDLKRILSLIDGKSSVDELAKRAPPSLREGCRVILGELEEEGYIRDKNRPHIEPKITVPKFNPLKMFTPKPSVDLDFNTPSAAPVPNVAELAARQKADEAAQLEAAVAAAKARASAEAASRAEAKARQEAEIMARGKALAEADAAVKAEAKAKKDAEIEERARAVAEANAKREAELRAQAGAKAKQEALARMQAEQEAARNRAALDAAAKVRAEIEAAARAQQVAEAKAKEEAAARLQAQHEAARAKAALEVAARAKAAAEARARAEIEAAARAQQEAEAKAKRDAEAARLKVEQEAARVKAELEAAAKAKLEAEAALLKAEQEAVRIRAELAAAKVRAEAEAKAVAEARAKQEAEAKALAEARARQEAEEKARLEAEAARIKAEHAAALLRAEQEAVAKVRAEAEARDRREAEEQARREAEVARVKAEHEAALARAEQDAVARVRAEADARLRAEEEAKAIAEALAKQLHEEAVAKLEAEERAKRAVAEAVNRLASPPAYEIQLDDFTGAAPPVASARPAVVQPGNVEAELDAEQLAAAKAVSEIRSASDIAAEMARLKEESEAARRKLQEEARRKEEEEALAAEQARAWAEAEQRAQTQSLQEVEQAAQVAQSLSRAQQMPVVRKRRKPLPLGKISFVLSVLAIIVALVLPYVYPLEEYIAPLERSLSAQLKQPVRIGKLSASSLPPKLMLHSVTLGSAQEVKIAGIVLSFDVLSLLSDVKVIDDAELQDVSIQGALLDKQAASLKFSGANRQYPVRHLTVQRLKIVTDEVALPVFSGIADIDVQGAISRVALHSADDKLGIDLQSDQGRWQLGVNLKESSLFFLPDVVFSDLSAKGVLGDGEINFTEFDAHIYNGMLLGSAKLNWLKGWQLQGHLEAKTFELNKMFPKYGIEGELYGEGAFTFGGGKISQMVEVPTLDGSFSVKKGIINGFDMVETARLLSREHMVGGRTHFDDMIGLVQFGNHITRFRQVRIVSNMLSASGTFDVSATNQLGGNLGAEIKMRTGNNALTLFGTVTEPKLRAGN